jgi:hypothetical protein
MLSPLVSNFLEQHVPGMYRLILDVQNVPDKKKNTKEPYGILNIYISIYIILFIVSCRRNLTQVPVSLMLT